MLSKQADDDVAVEDGHGGLVAVQDAVLDGPRRRPVEHARRVVLHLRLLEVKVLRLVVRDANLKLLWLLTSVLRLVRRPASFGT